MRLLFTLAIFLNALLLFGVQPMIAKALLPTFGGAPAVWLVSMAFFQLALLGGYGYGHWVGRLGKKQIWVHVGLLLISAATLPFRPALHLWEGAPPEVRLLAILLFAVGPTFVLVSAGAPLIQRWFAHTGDPAGKRPYFLYSASNLGSMAALLSYPALIEPRATIGEQFTGWALGFAGLWLVLVGVGALTANKWAPPVPASEEAPMFEEEEVAPAAPAPKQSVWQERLRWVALSAVPSALLLGVTNYLTANVAPVPLLWVVPLALYLLSYTIGFASRPWIPYKTLARFLPLAATPLIVPIVLESSNPLAEMAAFHLGVFFIAAWMCHSGLNETAPHANRATEFYFYLALGGVIGGATTALFAPLIFKTYAEYPIALALACALRPTIGKTRYPWLDYAYPAIVLFTTYFMPSLARKMGTIPGLDSGGTWIALTLGVPAIFVFLAVDFPLRHALGLLAVWTAAQMNGLSYGGKMLSAERSFFGVHRVTESGNWRSLVHGNTVHGRQNLEKPDLPLTYYHPTGPIGQVFKAKDAEIKRAALIGLGVGSLAAYGKLGRSLTFFEIDPVVIKTATNPQLFSFVHDSKSKVDIVLGDGRQKLRESEGLYDLIVLDAFSSDAIPAHLLTREAIREYLKKLAPHGIMAIHISNRYLKLDDVVGQGCKEEGLVSMLQLDTPLLDEEADGKTASQWMIAARSKADFGDAKMWSDFEPIEGSRAWTDDYSNLWNAFLAKRED